MLFEKKKKFVPNYMLFYNTNETLMLFILLWLRFFFRKKSNFLVKNIYFIIYKCYLGFLEKSFYQKNVF